MAAAAAASPGIESKFAERFGIDPNEVKKILKATAFRQQGEGEVSDAQMAALLIVADKHGLNPFTREIYAFPDKQNGIVPIVSVDGWVRITNEHPQFDGLEFRYSETWAPEMPGLNKPLHEWIECTIYRKDRSRPTVIREYGEECYKPPFKGKSKYPNGADYTIEGPWQTHPRRFLRHRALIQASRVAFGFALGDPQELPVEIDMGAADEVGGQQGDDLMPRALTDNPTEHANFSAGLNGQRQAEPAQQQGAADKPTRVRRTKAQMAADEAAAQQAQQAPQNDPLDPGQQPPAEAPSPVHQPQQPAPKPQEKPEQRPERPEVPAADYTAAPNRFAREAPARKTTAAQASTPAPEQQQPTFFEDEGTPPAEPVSPSMLTVLQRKMQIAGKTEVDMQAKFGHGLHGVTKANFNTLQTWATA